MSETPHDSARAEVVQKLLDDDVSGLRAYETSASTPSFELQLVESGATLSKSDLKACIDLVDTTSGKDYRASSIGWHRSSKAEEMSDPEMIFLLLRETSPTTAPHTQALEASRSNDSSHPSRSSATPQQQTQDTASPPRSPTPPHARAQVTVSTPRTPTGRIIGFISFMFTIDDPPHEDREVVYIYEVHLAESLRGQGLGSELIGFVEIAARHCGLSKTMLTVFTANKGARALYERLGYGKDACSPRDRVMRRKVVKADYVIMSKELGLA